MLSGPLSYSDGLRVSFGGPSKCPEQPAHLGFVNWPRQQTATISEIRQINSRSQMEFGRKSVFELFSGRGAKNGCAPPAKRYLKKICVNTEAWYSIVCCQARTTCALFFETLDKDNG